MLVKPDNDVDCAVEVFFQKPSAVLSFDGMSFVFVVCLNPTV
jgi:hypothetical protein